MGNFSLAQNEHSTAYKVIKGYDDTDAAAIVEGDWLIFDFNHLLKNFN